MRGRPSRSRACPLYRPPRMAQARPPCGPSKPHAMSSARRASTHRDSGRLHKAGPIRSRCASATWSKFSAHTVGIPSPVVKTTSVVNPRIVRVAGTTMISFRRSMTSSRVRIRTGRRLSGSRNVYQRILPRLNRYPPSPRRPKQAARRPRKTRRAKVARTGRRMRRRPVASQSTAAAAHVLAASGSRPTEGYRQPSKLWPSLEF